MPAVTIQRPVTMQEAEEAVQQRLGSDYKVTESEGGSREEFKVAHSAVSLATVRLERAEKATTFHVSGGGLAISRLVNQLSIAKKVSSALEDAFGQSS